MPKDTFFNLPEEKRQKIINAAIDLFTQLDYSKVSINGIVQAAGIPKGSFYQYFENKDDLYIYLFTEVGDTKLDMFESLRGQVPVLNFRDYMLAYIGQLKKLESSNSKMALLKQEFLNECPQHIKKQILKSEMPKSMKRFRVIIEDYMEKGEFRRNLDSRIAAYVTVMSISNLENYDYSQGDDMLTVLLRIIDFLTISMN